MHGSGDYYVDTASCGNGILRLMRYFPINLDMRGKRAVVVGGGEVALRKCLALADAGAEVRLVSPSISEELRKLSAAGQIIHQAEQYKHGDLEGAFMAFAATDSREVNSCIAREAAERGILLNVADSPQDSTFVSPAIMARGELLIAVSTGGKSPALARRIRDEIGRAYGAEYAHAVDLLGEIREKLLTSKGNRQYNKRLLSDLAGLNLPELLRKNDTASINHLLTELLGPDYTLENLKVGEKDPR